MSYDKVVLITGASRGLGRAAAQCLSKLGCSLALCARAPIIQDAPWFEAMPEERRLYAGVDLRRPDAINAFARKVQEKFGRLDLLINCASVLGTHTSVADSEIDDWQEAVSVNILGSAAMLKACCPMLRRTKGGFIQVVSSAGLLPVPHLSTYCATKAAQIMLTRAFAAEQNEITAVNYDPSMMDTDMQTVIRTEIVPGMPEMFKQYFNRAYDDKLMIDAADAGCTLAYTACHLSPEQHDTRINGGDPQLQITAQKWFQAAL